MTRGDSRDERLEAETQRLLRLSRSDKNSLDISEEEARQNIHDFLERLGNLDDPFSDPQISDNNRS